MSKTGQERVAECINLQADSQHFRWLNREKNEAFRASHDSIAADLDTLARIRVLAWPFRQHLRECDDGGHSCLSASNAATVSDLRALLRAIGGET